ncbi:uncharacterized protein LOC135695119 isoform X2 [Rhopilema esculentum]|uniref:uncharacterized protein LOC135695119 isoform X2 n=1 Tax=Rhopilema esculentum TaxID=499914 RepID=UPI0031DDE44F
MEMRLTLLLALIIVVTGKPMDGMKKEDHVVFVTPIPEVKKDIFPTMIGRCTYKKFTFDALKCSRKFYLSFRSNRVTPCSKRFNVLEQCYMEKIVSCLKNTVNDKVMASILSKYKVAMKVHKQLNCGDTKYDIRALWTSNPDSKLCPKGTIDAINQCNHLWFRMFKKNRGDPRLCKEYELSKSCTTKTLDKCSFDMSKSSWIFEEKALNPFCDAEQLAAL